MTDCFFFGYGSLVNARTHSYPETHMATLAGWKRSWRHTNLRPFPFLSVIKDDASQISGLMARVPGDDWSALDLREKGYARQTLSEHQVSHNRPAPATVQIYQTLHLHDITGRASYPILLSYLDVVVQGFLDIYGEQGVTDFFASTDGWEAAILDDRSAPLYARHQTLSKAETELVDDQLSKLSSKIEKL